MTATVPAPIAAEHPAAPGPLKALTLHQPWASLVAVGAKTIETRSRRISHRGPLAIHAGKEMRPFWEIWDEGHQVAGSGAARVIDALAPLEIDPLDLATEASRFGEDP